MSIDRDLVLRSMDTLGALVQAGMAHEGDLTAAEVRILVPAAVLYGILMEVTA